MHYYLIVNRAPLDFAAQGVKYLLKLIEMPEPNY